MKRHPSPVFFLLGLQMVAAAGLVLHCRPDDPCALSALWCLGLPGVVLMLIWMCAGTRKGVV